MPLLRRLRSWMLMRQMILGAVVLLLASNVVGCRIRIGPPASTPTPTKSVTAATVPEPTQEMVVTTPSPLPSTRAPSTPTSTPFPSTPTPAAVTDILLRDDFGDPTSGFSTRSSDETVSRMGYVDGEYEMVLVTAPGTLDQSSWTSTVLQSQTFGDFRLEIDARIIGEPKDGGFAILFRATDFDNYYKFQVDPMRSMYTLFRLLGNRQTRLVDWTSSASIRRAAPNRLGVVAKGSEISVLVNGTLLATVKDDGFSSGKIGMMINAWSEPFAARFDNLLVAAVE